MRMRIRKILNNNVVISHQEDTGEEIVVMGKGIAFQKAGGDIIEKDKIEKVFTLKDEREADIYEQMIKEISPALLDISEEIIIYGENILEKKLENNIHIALADHISFAVHRHKNGLVIKNHLLWEIKKLYKKEFKTGLWGLELIGKKLGMEMPEDEAGFIALHLINATMGEEMPNTVDITEMVQDILNLIKYILRIDYDDSSLSYERLVTHIRFFAQRIVGKKNSTNMETPFYGHMRDNYQQAFHAAERIKDYIQKNHDYTVGRDEIVYLCIHLQRLIDENKTK